jgi:hypothetical protein
VARTSSPVHDDADKLEEWLNYIEDNPIPTLLNFYSADHIRSVFNGASPATEERSRVRDEVVERPREPMRESVRETRDNGPDDPPFDVDEAPRAAEPPRRAPLGNGNGNGERERPTPREVEPSPERRRATIAPEPTEDNKRSIDALRSRLASRGGNA